MTPETLCAAMPGLSLERSRQLVAGANEALRTVGAVDQAHLKRAAMFLAQIGHESVSLMFTEEIADGSDYEGRADLGNTQPGDGRRFKGRSFIQITGRTNYDRFSLWAFGRGLVPSSDHFVQRPLELAGDRWAWLGAVWYWLVARSTLNDNADAGDIRTCTLLINGGLNGFQNRLDRYNLCLGIGTAILPSAESPATLAARPVNEEDDVIIWEATDDDKAFYVITGGSRITKHPRPAPGKVGGHEIAAADYGRSPAPDRRIPTSRIRFHVQNGELVATNWHA